MDTLGLNMEEKDVWLAVQLDSRPCDNKQGNGELIVQPQRVKFCPFSYRASRWAQLAWEPLLWYREPSHALPNFRATETGNQWSGIISTQLVTVRKSIAYSFSSQGDQCCTSFPGCIITCYYFDLVKCILPHPYFQNCACPCFLLFSSNPASNLRDLPERMCAMFLFPRRQMVRTEVTSLKEYTFLNGNSYYLINLSK